jgi:hypothetical protein
MGAYTGKWVVAKKAFGYAGKSRDAGEVFQLAGMRNDDAIWGLTVEGNPKLGRYTDPFSGDPKSLPKCAECGALFNNHASLNVHGVNKHGG